ncbi:RagB/SusD family nutrient uptake outer membrane protein [Dyadobacter flavalbus]|uniref:RagB/SusD family nutrient uptake outer membrane protein n=1 Tax=Dyadobacter flavalbus TaxID=2579942 RepID=A0A5M8QLM7_9BACT|nr:RagB/SusD family nutrient uptake outer membrane protein [Dyadobacter flavalbus]KAA6437045.1 RagB/SusD family nutrient uptake outer membrane protein [Dyadobacter flavalbus]
MKKYSYLALALSTLFIASCKEFLTEEPASVITEEQYYKTESDANTAINAVYFFLNSGRIQTPYNTLFNTGMNMGSDDEDPGPGATNPDVRSLAVQSHSSSNLRVYEIWQQHYAAIRKDNVVLNKIPAISFSIPGNKERILGEAKFLRALFYFNLVRLYGDVPLVTEYQNYVSPSDYAIAKSPSADVYAQIEKDLTEAAAVLPASYSSPDLGRATSGAAKALLAKVYLIKASLPLKLAENYQKAISKAEEALSPADGGTGVYGYDLATDYAKVFLPAFKNGTEHIFSAQMKANSYNQGNNEMSRAIFSAIPGLTGNYAHMVRYYTEGEDKFFSIYKLFKPTDKRRAVTFVRSFTSPANGKKYALPLVNPAVPNDSTPFWNKWWDPNNTAVTSNSEANVPIIRYAELLLIHAEAENEVNGPTVKAYKSINRVRARAGLPNLTAGLTKNQFRDSVYFERRLELVYEYQRWFDLIREKDADGNGILLKSLQKVGKTNATEKNYLYPIPQTELDNNPLLKQNVLWE